MSKESKSKKPEFDISAEIDYEIDKEVEKRVSSGEKDVFDKKDAAELINMMAQGIEEGEEMDFELSNGDVFTIEASEEAGGVSLPGQNPINAKFYINGEEVNGQKAVKAIEQELDTRYDQARSESLEGQIDAMKTPDISPVNNINEIYNSLKGQDR